VFACSKRERNSHLNIIKETSTSRSSDKVAIGFARNITAIEVRKGLIDEVHYYEAYTEFI